MQVYGPWRVVAIGTPGHCMTAFAAKRRLLFFVLLFLYGTRPSQWEFRSCYRGRIALKPAFSLNVPYNAFALVILRLAMVTKTR